LPYVSLVIMPLSRPSTEMNEIFLFSQELSLSCCHFYSIIPCPFLGLNLGAQACLLLISQSSNL
jgi:hypothetical protein